MKRFAAATLAGTLDLLLPPCCPLCRAGPTSSGDLLCAACRGLLQRQSAPFCPICAVAYDGRGPCHPCARCAAQTPPFERVHVYGPYRGSLALAITRMKVGGDLVLRGVLEDLLLRVWEEELAGETAVAPFDSVVPVPAGIDSLRQRGADLPALLARSVAERLGTRWRPRALLRRSGLPDLAGLNAGERAIVARQAYAAREALQGRVLLVDDVVTTTATVRACSRLVLAAGGARVTVLALARTPLTPHGD